MEISTTRPYPSIRYDTIGKTYSCNFSFTAISMVSSKRDGLMKVKAEPCAECGWTLTGIDEQLHSKSAGAVNADLPGSAR